MHKPRRGAGRTAAGTQAGGAIPPRTPLSSLKSRRRERAGMPGSRAGEPCSSRVGMRRPRKEARLALGSRCPCEERWAAAQAGTFEGQLLGRRALCLEKQTEGNRTGRGMAHLALAAPAGSPLPRPHPSIPLLLVLSPNQPRDPHVD